jgi:hypothetical protein
MLRASCAALINILPNVVIVVALACRRGGVGRYAAALSDTFR